MPIFIKVNERIIENEGVIIEFVLDDNRPTRIVREDFNT
jgi:hypothetical protein